MTELSGNSEQLKPCPFCGGEAEFYMGSYSACTNYVVVKCRKCNAKTEEITGSVAYCAKDVARDLWNRRVD